MAEAAEVVEVVMVSVLGVGIALKLMLEFHYSRKISSITYVLIAGSFVHST